MNGVHPTGKWTHESTVQSLRVFLSTSLGSPLFWSTKDQLVFSKNVLSLDYKKKSVILLSQSTEGLQAILFFFTFD